MARLPRPADAGPALGAWPQDGPGPVRDAGVSPRSGPGRHGRGAPPPPLRLRAAGGAGAGRAREAGHSATLARALSSCCRDGRDTSLTRIAVFSVTFIPGMMASAAQCPIAGAAWHQVPIRRASGAHAAAPPASRPPASRRAG